MASYNKFQIFVQDIGNGVHNLSSHAVKCYLSNTAPVNTNSIKANIAEISTGNGYAGPVTLSTVSYSQTSGTASLVAADFTVTASGGSVGPFRYIILYNDTPSSPADPLIGWWDYGSAVTLADGESFTVDFSTSLFTLA